MSLREQLRDLKRDRDACAERVAKLEAKRDEVDAQVEALRTRSAELNAAKLAAAEAFAAGEATEEALSDAQHQFRESLQAIENAGDTLAGIVALRAKAVEKAEKAQKDYEHTAVRVIVTAAGHEEARAYELFTEFALVMRRRHALAKLASRLDTDARGYMSEPLPVSSQSSGLLLRTRPHGDSRGLQHVLRDHCLTDSFAPDGIPEFEESRLFELKNLDEIPNEVA